MNIDYFDLSLEIHNQYKDLYEIVIEKLSWLEEPKVNSYVIK